VSVLSPKRMPPVEPAQAGSPAARTQPAARAAVTRRRRVFWLLGAAALLMIVLFLTVSLRGNLEYALILRGRKVLGLVLVGAAIAYSTALFQTVTNNRILTPSIMGFDSLFVLIQTGIVFFFGSSTLTALGPQFLFALETVAMVAFALLLYQWLFRGSSRSLYTLVLVGIILGTLFGSLGQLAARMIDPNEFLVLQDSFFASFNSIDPGLLVTSAVIFAACAVYGARLWRRLDVLALGPDTAVGLGVSYRSTVNQALVLVAVLVAVSTALVGPVTFLGLLVVNLARQLTGSHLHRFVLPASALLAVIALVGGQLVLERVFGLNTSLSIIINFVGGIYFIGLLIRESRL
jgi:iron complex transport system permease protein